MSGGRTRGRLYQPPTVRTPDRRLHIGDAPISTVRPRCRRIRHHAMPARGHLQQRWAEGGHVQAGALWLSASKSARVEPEMTSSSRDRAGIAHAYRAGFEMRSSCRCRRTDDGDQSGTSIISFARTPSARSRKRLRQPQRQGVSLRCRGLQAPTRGTHCSASGAADAAPAPAAEDERGDVGDRRDGGRTRHRLMAGSRAWRRQPGVARPTRRCRTCAARTEQACAPRRRTPRAKAAGGGDRARPRH